MAETVRVKFTAKPGLYPPHKGGRTWLHERAAVRKVPFEGAPNGETTKVFPSVILQSGDVIDVSESDAATLVKRYQCFSYEDESDQPDDLVPVYTLTEEEDVPTEEADN